MALFSGLPRSAGTSKVKPIWILLKQETVSGSSISWAMCVCTSFQHHTTLFIQAGCPSCHLTNSVNALKALQQQQTLWNWHQPIVMARYIESYWISRHWRHIVSHPYHDNYCSNKFDILHYSSKLRCWQQTALITISVINRESDWREQLVSHPKAGQCIQ